MNTNSYQKENLIKNVTALIVAIIFYPFLSASFSQIRAGQMNDILLTISLLLVTVCFGNFAFTYEKSRMQTWQGKYISHCATFIFLLLTALLLESLTLAFKTVYPSLYGFILICSVLLYIGVVLYDFWDYLRSEN